MADLSTPFANNRTWAAEMVACDPQLPPAVENVVSLDGSETTRWARRRLIGSNVARVCEELP